MQRLIYTSSARYNLKPSHINDILGHARANNRNVGITGLLVFHEGVFLQVLEGEHSTLTQLYARIRRDWRHTDCKALLAEPVAARMFPDWTMAYRPGEALEAMQTRLLGDIMSVVGSCKSGEFEDQPMLNVYLRAFLASVRIRDAA